MEDKLIMKKAYNFNKKSPYSKKLQVSDEQHAQILEISEYTGKNIYEITWTLLDFALNHVQKEE